MTRADTHIASSLADEHREELHKSGLSDDTIADAGIYSTSDEHIRDILGWCPKTHNWGRGMVFPFAFPSENKATYLRVKPDFPRMNGAGKPVKYESPRKAPNRVYFPPGFWEAITDTSTIAVTEGEKKALAVMQVGVPCIGLVGVWGWQEKRKRSDTGRAYGERRLNPDLGLIDWKGRDVVVVFDSDAAENPSVQLAESRLAEALTKLGANVRVARIPPNGDDKVGIDDFLVACGDAGLSELKKLIDEAQEPQVPDKLAPMDWAHIFVEDHFMGAQGRELLWWRDEFYRWTGTHYVVVADSELQAIVFSWLDSRQPQTKPRHASDVSKALASLCRLPFKTEAPCFINLRDQIDPRNIISFANGLLDSSAIGGDMDLYDHTPSWFSTTSLPYSFDAKAQCPTWDSFLREVFEGDLQRIDLLQRWFGLCLTADTSYQKLLMLVGPKRSGKGTTLRTLQHVVGKNACVSPTLSSLASEFGLWQLLGKAIAMFPDAHLGRRVDSMRVLEVIKSIVGEDSVSVNRKNLPYLTNCRLSVRFMITVNELPRFSDASDALGSRLLILPFEKSFAGGEDRKLEGKLMAEASGIMNWSLRGLYQLREAGVFDVPDKAQAVLDNYRRLTAPITGFVEDLCIVRPDTRVACNDLYAAWRRWCERNGHEPGANSTFGMHLQAAELSIERKRVREGRVLAWCYVGIELSTEEQASVGIL